jgi:hypothetical protein
MNISLAPLIEVIDLIPYLHTGTLEKRKRAKPSKWKYSLCLKFVWQRKRKKIERSASYGRCRLKMWVYLASCFVSLLASSSTYCFVQIFVQYLSSLPPLSRPEPVRM